MQFVPPLVEARLIKRYKRFLADMEIPGESGSARVTVHCPNPGSMLGLAEPGSRCWLMPRPAVSPGTKLPYGWEIVETHAGGVTGASGATALVGINTARANAIVAEGLAAGVFPNLPTAAVAREVRVGAASRLDFRLGDADGRPCWVEVKSVTLSRRAGIAEFPDAKTERGTRHLAELGALAQAGQRAVLLFLVQRNDCREMALAADIDPTYAAALTLARAQGVEIRAVSCGISPLGIDAGAEIAFIHG
ncbi:DNA/RNA nuclease SfsA [Dongia sedimenti]|uniref:Sugar fermentation stimulation protein homolog n=1 Tax=Dongia sedimenti TaxID=3064282 RepID=A0ABU0YGM3_9PROT|nr:DNA/RNA nuclease SfsA [Rhodospirillaceae bacterium R-7]